MGKSNINIGNKKAYYSYEILEKFEAGISLLGTEIKSIRAGKASLTDAYCKFIDNELWVLMSISEYSHGGVYNHEPNRERKLLLTKRELNRLARKAINTGLTIVPLKLYINSKGLAKMQIALAKGKREFDKRNTIKDRDAQREMSRIRKIRL
ncbi:MAG: SsrA-binding protein SmpB [Bacteroidales bacterium]|nr:SsrA-binding protein SmpB [Bacteroidales bacterium]